MAKQLNGIMSIEMGARIDNMVIHAFDAAHSNNANNNNNTNNNTNKKQLRTKNNFFFLLIANRTSVFGANMNYICFEE